MDLLGHVAGSWRQKGAASAGLMDRQTKEVIHDAIARQLSNVFPAIDLEIITEVVDAQVSDAVRRPPARSLQPALRQHPIP